LKNTFKKQKREKETKDEYRMEEEEKRECGGATKERENT
jgi:hypothetical protein